MGRYIGSIYRLRNIIDGTFGLLLYQFKSGYIRKLIAQGNLYGLPQCGTQFLLHPDNTTTAT